MKFEYFMVLLATAIVPLIRSFSREINFYSDVRRFVFAILIPFVLFAVIDIISVQRGLWTFNKDYITGIYLFNLPVEELLFFAVIPFSCLFLWETVKYFDRRWNKK